MDIDIEMMVILPSQSYDMQLITHSHSIIFNCQAPPLSVLKFFLPQPLRFVITLTSVTSSAFLLHERKIEFRMQHYMYTDIGKILPSLPLPLPSSAPYLQVYVSVDTY